MRRFDTHYVPGCAVPSEVCLPTAALLRDIESHSEPLGLQRLGQVCPRQSVFEVQGGVRGIGSAVSLRFSEKDAVGDTALPAWRAEDEWSPSR
jgi:hypothetical protein